jgi:hypothetical protein
MNSYTKSEIIGDRFVATKIVEETIYDLQIEQVSGDAVLTHVGAYRRIKFIFDGDVFTSQNSVIAVNEGNTRCVSFINLTFDKDIEMNWNRFVHSDNPEHKHWIEAV